LSFLKRIPAPLGAVLLGALTFVVTPLAALLVAVPFLIMTGFRQGAAVELIAKAFRLEGLGGFFGAMMILGGLFWLLGCLAMGFVSWRIYRDQRLVALTVVSAFGFQIVRTILSFTIATVTGGHDAAGQDSAFAMVQRQIEGYAALGTPQVTVRGRHDDWGDDYLEFGPYYEFLDVSLPILVRRPGNYHLEVRYQGGHPELYSSGAGLDTTLALGVGSDTLRLGFRPSMYRSPEYTGGSARAEMRYMITQRQYFALARPSLRMSSGGLRGLEAVFERDPQMPRDEFVDSSGVFIPRTITKAYVRQVRHTDRDDRGRPLRRSDRR
jgi:hypothetical protein